jgi:hypothetical protein
MKRGEIRKKPKDGVGDHVMLNLCRESQGPIHSFIHSFKFLRENIKQGPFTLWWSIVQVFDIQWKMVRNEDIKNKYHIL